MKSIISSNLIKSKLITLVGLLFIFSNASAESESRGGKCQALRSQLPGSYIGQRSSPEFTTDRIDQLQLHADGTAYWYQSHAINLPISGGTYTPAIGAWIGDTPFPWQST